SSLVLLAALIYLAYELKETRRQNQELVQQLLQVQQQGGGSGEGQETYLKGAVKNTIVKHAQSIQSCFLKLIESNPELPESGRVLVDWQIDSEGKVFEAGVIRDEFSNKEFQTCLKTNIGGIVFPAPPSGRSIYVEHTFLFRKEENN
ncbi:MAG: AgmX/PglI C-terminal domain-containing protein, partial [Deltaproteobacteria bacterium]|nr:AgmX/PglI C-terminal domain-containing protein [Deltaproteobacteria bacterium]